MPQPTVAVVILNWNGKAYLEKFLPHVIQCSPDASVVVADNHSTDQSVTMLRERFPAVRIIENSSNFGFAEGYNKALAQVDTDYYVLLNSDVEVTPGWLDPIVALMQSDNTIAACQPKILDHNNRQLFEYAGASGGYIDKYCYPFCRGRLFNSLEEDQGQYNDRREVFWATGACMFVRASAFWEADGLDADYFAHMEEIDLCWRMKNLGYRIYVEPASVVYHVGGGTLNKISPRKTFLNFRNNLVTLTKNQAPQFLYAKLFYRMVLDGVAGIKFLLEGHGSHFVAVIKAHFSYYGMFASTLRKRRAFRRKAGFRDATTCIFDQNIVYLHYIRKIKKFSELSFQNASASASPAPSSAR